MKDYQAKNIRNIAVVGHGSEGKTTLVEALLYTSGTIDRQGRVEDGNTVTDSDKEEQSRQISISAAVAPLEWKDVKVNLIDVPGYFDFAGEMVGPMAVSEGAIITVGAVSGLNVGAEKAWDMCDKTHTSRMIVINQMDRENANFSRALATITDKYGSHIAPIEVPIVEGGKFTGVVCVLENKAYTGEGKTLKEIDIPANMAGDVESAREAIMEAAAGAEDELMEKYFEEGELSQDEIMHGLRQGIKDGTVVPVVCCSSLTRVGLAKLLDNLIDLMPSPRAPRSRASTPRAAIPRSASAPTISPSPPACSRRWPTRSWASCRFSRSLPARSLPARRFTTPTRKRPRRPATSTSCAAASRTRRRRCARATSAPSPSWAASPPATRCATRTSL